MIERAGPETIAKAAAVLKAGGLVAMPTETVYGLAADARRDEAVAKIYALKSRPAFNPLIVHVLSEEAAAAEAEWPQLARALAGAFWPGPLTLVCRAKPETQISLLARAGLETVALRAPNHPVARDLLAAFGGPIVAPSANRSGGVSPTTAAHVAADFGAASPLILDGGPTKLGLESTVVGLSDGRPRLLRPGALARAAIEAMTGPLEAAQGDSLAAPGMMASHYATRRPLRLDAQDVQAGEALLAFGPDAPAGAIKTLNLSESGDLTEAAARLFAALRALDAPPATAIAVMPVPDEGLGEAINDRLRRAAFR